MNEPAIDYADVLMQQEHLSRQQRIRLVQKATKRKGRSRPAVLGIHDAEVAAAGKARPITPARPMAAAGKARSITPAGPTTTCHGTMHGKIHKTKDHSEHGTAKAVGKAKQGHANNASSRGNTNTRREAEVRLARRIEQKGREDVAEQHYLKAVLLKVWRALSSVTEIALLQKVKAERHHQYCVLHLIWINLIHNVSCSRAHKTEQVERVIVSMKKREAWKRWKHHHQGLVNASNMVRRERVTSSVSQHFSTWVEAWTVRARQSAVVELVATRSGQRARKSRFFREWKAALHMSKQRTLLAEERFQMWQRVEHWLTPADSL